MAEPEDDRKRHALRRRADTAEENTLQVQTAIEEESIHMLEVTQQTSDELQLRYTTLAEEAADADRRPQVDGEIASIKRALVNFLKGYQQLLTLEDEFDTRWSELQNVQKKKKRRVLKPAPPNGVIDEEEKASNHFAQGTNIYKILLICYVGSFLGVIVELIWCLIYNGYIESRSGILYGPFNPLYGVGAILMTLILYRFRNHSGWISFLGGMLIGAVLEYFCSWLQETLFGSTSWDYTDRAFNLNGRICLFMCILWGILAIWWIKSVYPRMSKWILKIPNRAGKIGTWIFTVFFLFDCIISVVAVARWSQRVQGVEATNSVQEFLDEHYPDERMERIFANMDFGDS